MSSFYSIRVGWVVVKIGWVMVGPTTPDQCEQNSDHLSSVDIILLYLNFILKYDGV